MELKWLEDLIALAEADTLSQAAYRRNVTQPAFSRRIKAIEDWFGTAVIDRNRKPARITPAIADRVDEIQALAIELRRLRSEVRAWENTQHRIVIAAQHTLSIAFLPPHIANLLSRLSATTIRLRSGNQNEIYAMLMTSQAKLIVAYETASDPLTTDEALLEKKILATDRLVPVIHADADTLDGNSGIDRPTLNIIDYPADSFFGKILHGNILLSLGERFTLTTICESALVPAIVELVLAGIGIAWVPSAMTAPLIHEGQLVDLSDRLESMELTIIAARLRKPTSRTLDAVWEQLGGD